MKRAISTVLLAAVFLISGCGGDDESTSPEVRTPIVQVNLDVGAPSMNSADEIEWNSVTATTLSLTVGAVSKAVPTKASAVSSSVKVQAIKSSDRLYLRFVWTDASNDIIRDNWVLNDATEFNFTHNNGGYPYGEDQLFVMFSGAPSGGWDVWNWRSLTTGKGHLAEGYTFFDGGLVRDVGNQIVALENVRLIDQSRPLFVHEDQSGFEGDVLYLPDTATLNTTALGWETGMMVPGWIIDTAVANYSETIRASRWDIDAVDAYHADVDEYHLVLSRKINTGFVEDLSMATATSVTTRVVILQNELVLNPGSSNQGYTANFNLVF